MATVTGESDSSTGVFGESNSWIGVLGESKSTIGGAAVGGEHKAGGTGVSGISETGIGVFGRGGKLAGLFQGDVEVTGDIRLANADCAEDFDIATFAAVEPGTVMVVGEEGVLFPSESAYDKRVAGVISGAGNYKPGLVLDTQSSQAKRSPGSVTC